MISRYKTILPWLLPATVTIAVIILVFALWSNDPLSTERPGSVWKVKERDPKTRDHTVPILLYHNIDGKGPFSLREGELRAHFQLFKDRDIQVISIRNMIEKLNNPGPFQEKVIALSFDDGFYSMYSLLLPLANEYRYPITLFVYTDVIYKRAKKNLTWENLKELERNGVAIECHTRRHPDLVKIEKKQTPESRRRLFEEIYLSKRVIELYLGKSIRYFAFPYGRYNLQLIRLCELAGYERVFSTDYGSNIVTRNNYCLRRRHIKSNYSIDLIQNIVE